jgi:hypothetical protein
MDKVQNPSNSVCYTPSSEPYRIYLLEVIEIGRSEVLMSVTMNSLLLGCDPGALITLRRNQMSPSSNYSEDWSEAGSFEKLLTVF